jgi:hypothetical protein
LDALYGMGGSLNRVWRVPEIIELLPPQTYKENRPAPPIQKTAIIEKQYFNISSPAMQVIAVMVIVVLFLAAIYLMMLISKT